MGHRSPNSPAFTEIAVCAGAGDRMLAHNATASCGQSVQRFSRVDVWSPQARQLCVAMQSAIGKARSLDAEHFEIQAQSWPDALAFEQGWFRTGWALLVSADLPADVIAAYRRDALAVVRFFEPEGSWASLPTLEASSAAQRGRPAVSLDHMTGEPLLGATLKAPIDIYIAGIEGLQLSGVLSRLVKREFSSRSVKLNRVQLNLAKVGGRKHFVSMIGRDQISGADFREDRVYFEERWRGQIAQAIKTPRMDITMEIALETLDVGRAKPRQICKLVNLTFGDSTTGQY